jgi:protein-tyrosine phosphatase
VETVSKLRHQVGITILDLGMTAHLFLQKLHCRYAHAPLDDSMPDTIAASAAYFIPFLRTAWPLVSEAAARGEGVLVHCSAGKHRSCSVACALLMMLGCPTLENAFQSIVRQRAICKPSFWPLLESAEFASFLLELRGSQREN